MEVLVVPAEPDEPDGSEVVRKTACHPDERDRLLREAEVLRAAAERGVNGLPAVIATPSAASPDPCLVTAAVAGPSLAVAPPLPVVEVAGVAAEVARLLAGLHEVGLVHGAVGPSHVVLDGAGGAILVGLGDGGPVGAPSPDPSAGALDPADDVAAWGALVGHLLDWSAAGEDEPLVALRRSLVDRRPRRGAARPLPVRAGEHERRVLAALADQAQDPDPARRPSARSLAAALLHRIPEARMPGAVSTAPPPRGSNLLDRLAAHVAATGAQLPTDTSPSAPAGAVDVAAAGGPPQARRRRRSPVRAAAGSRSAAPVPDVTPAIASDGSNASPGRSASRPRRVSPAPLLVPSASRKAPAAPEDGIRSNSAGADRRRRRSWLRAALPAAAILLCAVAVVAARPGASSRAARPVAPPAGCAPVSPPAADVDGDGCEESVAWAEGILHAGSARFALGGPGDAWAIGDWDCDGRRTPALLHRGSLAIFDTWPGPGAELRGRLVETAAGATGLIVVPGPDGCDRPSLLPASAGGVPVNDEPSP